MSIKIKGVRILRNGELVGVLAPNERKAGELRKQSWNVPVIVGTVEDAEAEFEPVEELVEELVEISPASNVETTGYADYEGS